MTKMYLFINSFLKLYIIFMDFVMFLTFVIALKPISKLGFTSGI